MATLDQDWLEADAARRVYRVAAGTRWSVVIAKLDAIGFSPAVMQSNNDFGVASTFSVNAHGWPVPFSGCGSMVRALTTLLADGTLVNCSRTENAELFSHAMGGYGLFGIITALELDMVPNALLTPTFETMSGRELGARFAEGLASDSTIQMAYGRLDVALHEYFVPAARFADFVTACQDVIPSSYQQLLNITLRYVDTDHASVTTAFREDSSRLVDVTIESVWQGLFAITPDGLPCLGTHRRSPNLFALGYAVTL